MSLGTHNSWKKQLIYSMKPKANKRLIDVACGTGDIAKLFFMRAKGKNSKIHCVDPNKKKNVFSWEKETWKLSKIYHGKLRQQKTSI